MKRSFSFYYQCKLNVSTILKYFNVLKSIRGEFFKIQRNFRNQYFLNKYRTVYRNGNLLVFGRPPLISFPLERVRHSLHCTYMISR